MKTLSLHDTMPIGKYKGEVITEIVDTDPQYLLWFIENVSVYKLTNHCKQAVYARYEELQPHTLTIHSRLPLYKYKGIKVINLMVINPSYLEWWNNTLGDTYPLDTYAMKLLNSRLYGNKKVMSNRVNIELLNIDLKLLLN